MKIRYLVDENLSARVVTTIQRHYPALDVLRVGDTGAPAFGTLDPDLLRWLETHQRVLDRQPQEHAWAYCGSCSGRRSSLGHLYGE